MINKLFEGESYKISPNYILTYGLKTNYKLKVI